MNLTVITAHGPIVHGVCLKTLIPRHCEIGRSLPPVSGYSFF